MNKTVITTLASALVAPIPFSVAAKGKSTIPEKPNIIVIMCDDMGYGDLGCYGQKYIKTPNIDSLASNGILISANLSMAGMLTGHEGSARRGTHRTS